MSPGEKREPIPKNSLYLAVALLLTTFCGVSAQETGSPIPGSNPGAPVFSGTGSAQKSSAPVPGGSFHDMRPVSAAASTGATGARRAPAAISARKSLYQQLPLTYEDARSKIEELSNSLAVSNPASVKNSIYALSEWLQDVASAHWKMYQAFNKSQSTRLEAKKERETALQFSHLKNRAKLLKADLFIKQKRYPEALQPLVEIVVAEPRTETGKQAYQRLIDMGFSQKVSSLEIAEGADKSPPASEAGTP